MLECFDSQEIATPITLLKTEEYHDWKSQQSKFIQKWLDTTSFEGAYQNVSIIPKSDGGIDQVVYIYHDSDICEFGALVKALPAGTYEVSRHHHAAHRLALGWALESYSFSLRKSNQIKAKFVWPKNSFEARVASVIYWVRDLINRPANDLTPAAMADETRALATRHKASIRVISGEDLIKENFPAVYAVGQAGPAPQLIDLCWGEPSHPKVTLVGKGVCFDSGGLDIKPAQGMRLMKKDMGGAAHALGLARLIMEEKLPLQLRVIIAAVENSIAGNAMHPGDILKTRKGLSVEVGHTDAEGRLILADCLALACEDPPDMLLDFATLTGAARVALGPDVPALFCNDEALLQGLLHHCQKEKDDLWHMPLWKHYRPYIESKVADLCNEAAIPYGGAITAALFLESFVSKTSWAHIDMMAWNLKARPGRPEGGEVSGLRGIFSYLRERYSNE